jgi:hypothetical protein
MKIKNIIFISLINSIFLASQAYSNDFNNSKNQDKNFFENHLKKIDTTIRIGLSNQNLGFDTPGANSVLYWHQEAKDFGIDLKYNFSPNFFTIFEYTKSKSSSGYSTDDDIGNGHGVYGRSPKVKGSVDDFKLNFGYKIYSIRENIPLFLTAGGFYKNVKVGDYGGWQISDGSSDNQPGTQAFPNGEKGNYTNSKYAGLMIGSHLEHKTSETKDSLQLDFLLPLSYKGDQIWYGRDPDSHWNLKNNKPGIGYRIKAEHGFKIGDLEKSKKYLKIYGYYEVMKFTGLTETQYSNSQDKYYRKKGGTPSGVTNGKAKFESFGAGIALEF